MKHTVASYTVRVIGVFVAGAASLLSIPLFMAATPDGNLGWVFYLWLLYCVCGFGIGCSLPGAWYLALLVAWMPLTLTPEYLGYISRGDDSWATPMFLLSPVFALVSGYLGSRFARWVVADMEASR